MLNYSVFEMQNKLHVIDQLASLSVSHIVAGKSLVLGFFSLHRPGFSFLSRDLATLDRSADCVTLRVSSLHYVTRLHELCH